MAVILSDSTLVKREEGGLISLFPSLSLSLFLSLSLSVSVSPPFFTVLTYIKGDACKLRT